ncbi:MAG: DUF4142 domain-containing protein [Desulfobacterales bacterium]|nr:DUF4142 domain-containing protein [Desulfobacterales bacterium]
MKAMSLLSVLILFGACAQMAGRATPDTLGEKETLFMQETAMAGVAEVQLGQLALQRSSSKEVKQFADAIVNDHTVADQQLRNLAEKKSVNLPAQPDEKHRTVADRLSRLKGSAFDRQYMSAMVKNHQKTVDRFKEQAEQGLDPELKAFADRNLPILQQHLDYARVLHGKLGG